MKKERLSNFELLRIISMLMIIIWHIFIYGVDMNVASPYYKFYFDIFRSIMVVHVNSYVLLTGYFQVTQKFKLSKVIQINNATLFYKIIFFIIFGIIGIAEVNSISILRNFFPLDLENYWFIRIYILLYLLSPFYNEYINSIDKTKHKKLLILLFILFSIISTFTNQEATVDNTVNYGYSIVSFTFLYFIGAYLRKYPIEKTYIGKRFTKNFQWLMFIFAFFAFALINFSIHFTSNDMINMGNGLINYIGKIIYISFNQYDNPLVLIGSVCYFFIFYFMKFKSKIINFISKACIGIYLFHENIFFRTNCYNLFNFPKEFTSRNIFVKIFLVGIIIFFLGFLIETSRQFIFKFIYNRKLSKKFRVKYRNFIDSLGIKMRW